MEVFLLSRKTQQPQKDPGGISGVSGAAALKSAQKLPCGTKQKLTPIDAVIKSPKKSITGTA